MSELLDLSKIAAPRDTVRLPSKKNPDGKAYEIINPSDLGVLELQKLSALNDEETKLRALARSSALKPAQRRLLTKTLGDAVKILVPSVEPSVLESLPNEAREQIIIAWIIKHYPDDAPGADAGAEGEAQSRRTTAASSRGSKRSTAATRKAGSTSRRGR